MEDLAEKISALKNKLNEVQARLANPSIAEDTRIGLMKTKNELSDEIEALQKQ